MLQEDNKTHTEKENKSIPSIDNQNENKDNAKNIVNQNQNILNITHDDKDELFNDEEEFDFYEAQTESLNEFNKLEKYIEEIKAKNDNDLDEYIKYYIEDLENFSAIFNLKDLIVDPKYTFKLLIRSLEKIIKFKYFYFKFTIPKIKKDESKKINEKKEKNINEIKMDKSNKNEINLNKKDIMANNNNNKNDKVKDENKDKKEKKIENKNIKIKMNVNIETKNKINEFETQKNEFYNKILHREIGTPFSNQLILYNNIANPTAKIDNNLKKDEANNKSKSNNKISSLEISINQSNQTSETNETSIGQTFSKLEDFIDCKSILSIINNKANVEEEDYVEGKNYESKVRKYFKVVLDLCSDKSLSVTKSSFTSIQGFYKFYEYMINENKIRENKNIFGNSKEKIEFNKLEFDLMVEHVSSKVINQIINTFKSNIIATNYDEKISQQKTYQIVGEIAKNFLSQSIDKNKQIGKIIDIFLIEEYLTAEEIENKNNIFLNDIIAEYLDLKLNAEENKFIFLFTNGSYLELKKAILYNEKELESLKENYDSVKIKSIFPIINKRRYCKNILYLKKIVRRLTEANIPFIIFYVGEELNNGIEQILINHIKHSKDKNNKYNSIILHLENNEKLIAKNIYQSFIIRTINKNLKKLNKNEIFKIIKDIYESINPDDLENYLSFLYDNLFKKKDNAQKYYILVFFLSSKKSIFLALKKNIDYFNNKNLLSQVNLISTTKKELLSKYSEYKNKKIIKQYIITDEYESKNGKILEYNIEFDVKHYNDINDINFSKINSDKAKEILKAYIFRNFSHFSREEYLKFDNLHEKLIYDIKALENELTLQKYDKINEKLIIDEGKKLMAKLVSSDIFKTKSSEILIKIRECIGNDIYKFLLENNEKKILKLIKKYLMKILEHVFCYSIYEKFFMETIFYKLSL